MEKFQFSILVLYENHGSNFVYPVKQIYIFSFLLDKRCEFWFITKART